MSIINNTAESIVDSKFTTIERLRHPLNAAGDIISYSLSIFIKKTYNNKIRMRCFSFMMQNFVKFD